MARKKQATATRKAVGSGQAAAVETPSRQAPATEPAQNPAELVAFSLAAQRLIGAAQKLRRDFSAPTVQAEWRESPATVEARFRLALKELESVRDSWEATKTPGVWGCLAAANAGIVYPVVVLGQNFTMAHEGANTYADVLLSIPQFDDDDMRLAVSRLRFPGLDDV